jgi:hypothetical protein
MRQCVPHHHETYVGAVELKGADYTRKGEKKEKENGGKKLQKVEQKGV